MKLNNFSEIFNEYAKLAEERGLVSSSPIKKEASKKEEEASDVEYLYGIKPNGKDDDKTIAEKAHPKTVVIAPAYDAMNGVVEDLYQRQSIMSHIALKTPNAKPIQRRYVEASNDLLKSLISTGFTLDNNNEIELMKLADSCSDRINKKAALPLILGLSAGKLALLVGSLAGLTYYFVHAAPLVQNIEENAKILLIELSEVKDKTYTGDLRNLVEYIRGLNNKLVENLRKLSVAHRLITESFTNNDLNNIVVIQGENESLINETKELLNSLGGSITQLNAFRSAVESEKDTDVSGEVWRKIKVVLDWAVSTADDDVVRAIDSLSEAISKAVSHAKSIITSVTAKYSNQIVNKIEVMQKEKMPELSKDLGTGQEEGKDDEESDYLRDLQTRLYGE